MPVDPAQSEASETPVAEEVEIPVAAPLCEELVPDVLEVSASNPQLWSATVLQVYRPEVIADKTAELSRGELDIPEGETMVRVLECEGDAALSNGESHRIHFYLAIDLNETYFVGYEPAD